MRAIHSTLQSPAWLSRQINVEVTKGTAMQGLIMKPNPETEIELYADANFTVRCNQEEGVVHDLVMSIIGYIRTYMNYLIIC